MLRASLPGNFTSGEIDAGNMSGTYDFKVQACNVAAQQCSGDSNIMVTTIPGSATTAASGLTVASSSISKNPLTAGDGATFIQAAEQELPSDNLRQVSRPEWVT